MHKSYSHVSVIDSPSRTMLEHAGLKSNSTYLDSPERISPFSFTFTSPTTTTVSSNTSQFSASCSLHPSSRSPSRSSKMVCSSSSFIMDRTHTVQQQKHHQPKVLQESKAFKFSGFETINDKVLREMNERAKNIIGNDQSKSKQTESKSPSKCEVQSFNNRHTLTAKASAAAARNSSRPGAVTRKKRYSSIHNKRFAKMDSISSHYAVAASTASISPVRLSSSQRQQLQAQREREVHVEHKQTTSIQSHDDDDEEFKPIVQPSSYQPSAIPSPTKRVVQTALSAAPKRRKMDVTGRMVELKSSGSRMNLKEIAKNDPQVTPRRSNTLTDRSKSSLGRPTATSRSRIEGSVQKKTLTPSRSVSSLAISRSSSSLSTSRSVSSLSISRPHTNSTKHNTTLPRSTSRMAISEEPNNSISDTQSKHIAHKSTTSKVHVQFKDERLSSSLDMSRASAHSPTPSTSGVRKLPPTPVSALKSRIPRSTSVNGLRRTLGPPTVHRSGTLRTISSTTGVAQSRGIPRSSSLCLRKLGNSSSVPDSENTNNESL